eukprot:6614067-Alexandrium_andersonii.AAC.1
MSASLVGSEMCIRDRVLAFLPEAFQQSKFRNALTAPSPLRMRAHACVSVSYTHLTLPTICSV